MSIYCYEALKPPEEEIRGVIEAESRREALLKLKSQGLLPLQVLEKTAGPRFAKKASFEELAILLQQLAVLSRSGIPLARALQLLAGRQTSGLLAQGLGVARERIEKGESLPRAFKASGIFPDFFCEMLSAAQTGENLEDIFLKAADFIGRAEDFKNRLSSALVYPAIILSLSAISVVVILRFIVPRIQQILLSFGKDLPVLTKVMISAAHLIWGLSFVFIPLGLLVFLALLKGKGLYTVHRLVLKLPVIGRLWLYFDLSRWSYISGLLLEAGVSLPLALSVGLKSMGNLSLRQKFSGLISQVERGEALSANLGRMKIVPSLLRDLVATGEESGQLPVMLRSASDIYLQAGDHLVEKTLKLVEPLTILIIGGIVAYIVVSVILPIMEISSAVRL